MSRFAIRLSPLRAVVVKSMENWNNVGDATANTIPGEKSTSTCRFDADADDMAEGDCGADRCAEEVVAVLIR